MAETNYVGQRLPRYDGMQHATGKTRYVGDIHLPGMLHVKAWRSPVASARILKIDVSRARKMPGVVAVITGAEVPVRGPQVRKTLFAGERGSAVAATSR